MPVTINGSTGLTTNNGSVFTDASGNAGVGTSNPAVYGARLAVSGGNIIADFDRTIGFQWSGGLNQYFKGMSGVPQLSGGARGLHVFNYDNDSSQGIRFWGGTFASKVEFGGFDSAGRMSLLLQPAFVARGFSNTNPGVKTFNSVSLNVGSHYNNSNGRFTAPVAGEYYISCSYLVQAGFSNIQFGLRVNGSDWAELKTGGSTVFTTSWSGVIPLAANDYVDFNYVSADTTALVTGNPFGQFSGFLLG